MRNLVRRKTLAEFAGWTIDGKVFNVPCFRSPDHLIIAHAALEIDVPAYESDPAAACSLLPKLMPLLPFKEVGEMMHEVGRAMYAKNEELACGLIWLAVARVGGG